MSVFDLKLGFKCNNDCIHCVVADKRNSGQLSLQEMLEIIDTVEPGSYLQITGGEPSTFKKELPIILKHGYERGLKPTIQTNGTGFADLDFAAACAPYVYNWHIAIHSCDPEVHDSIVKSKGMWEKTMQGFNNMLQFPNVVLTTQTVLSKLSIVTLYDTYKMIQEKAPGTQMSMTYPHLNGNAWNNRDLVAFRYSDYSDVFYKVLKDFEPFIFTESIPPCYLYPYLDHPSLEGDLLYNHEARVGVDFSQPEKFQDYNISDIKERRKAPRCQECCLNNDCIGVWHEYIEIFRKNLDLIPLTEKRMKKLDELKN